jgi:hypothetical protein
LKKYKKSTEKHFLDLKKLIPKWRQIIKITSKGRFLTSFQPGLEIFVKVQIFGTIEYNAQALYPKENSTISKGLLKMFEFKMAAPRPSNLYPTGRFAPVLGRR